MNGQILYNVLKQQRLAFSSAVIVGMTLTLIAHAPATPVVLGCVLVLLISIGRSLSNLKSAAREDR
ncbi:MAG TPA: hypothetical protein VMT28_06915 [Terriglobales bacterium]|nr:hypothetical protein [Terriglobales bacterium]